MANRVRGLDTTITVTGPKGVEEGLADVSSFEMEWQRSVSSKGYLGEKAERKDDIYIGISFSIELDISDVRIFDFIRRVNDRSMRRTPPTDIFNVVTTITLPDNNRTVRIQILDAKFGAIPLNNSGRDEYTSITVPGEASTAKLIY